MKWGKWTFSFFDVIFIFITLTGIGCLFFFPFLNYNNQALSYFFQKKYGIAEQKWLIALSQDSFSPFYRMNLALNYILLTQSDKAIQEYEVTRSLMKENIPFQSFKIQEEKTPSSMKEQKKSFSKQNERQANQVDDILFYTFFNSAISATQKGARMRALDFYQKALKLRPHSHEVKTNIELLVQSAPTSQQQDEQKKEESDSSNRNKDHQKDHQQGAKKEKDGLEEQEKKTKESSEDFDKKNKEQAKKENKAEMQNGQEEKGKKKEQRSQGGEIQDKKEPLDQQQTEAILKAILDQESKIRERRHQEETRPSPIEKDW